MTSASVLFKHVLITGGTGFIGSALAARLLEDENVERVTVYDVQPPKESVLSLVGRYGSSLNIVIADVRDDAALEMAMKNATLVIHLAANASTANGFHSPRIDVDDGLLLTAAVLECMRKLRCLPTLVHPRI